VALISTLELAKRYGITPHAVAYWIRKGQLKAQKLGKTWVIDEEDASLFYRPRAGRPPKQGRSPDSDGDKKEIP
jgi:predicted site-specific integrase-resolvase